MIQQVTKKLALFLLTLAVLTTASPAFASTVKQTSTTTNPIRVLVDGKEIVTDQPSIIQNDRTLVPLRAIFEALDAEVDFDDRTKTVYASKGNKLITLTIGSRNAYINNQLVILDVPAQIVNDRTLVPVRFVSEALGYEVGYDHAKREVTVKTNYISNLQAKDQGDFGDGRDLEVSFTKVDNESLIEHYRIIAVKTSKANTFTLDAAMNLPNSRYMKVDKQGTTIKRTFLSNSVDADGMQIQSDISYTIFVVTIAKDAKQTALSVPSAPVILTHEKKVQAVTNLQVRDVSEFGDGRDLEISFTKVTDETNLQQYRAIIVRSSDAKNFNLSAAKELPTTNYTVITKTGTNIKQVLSSSTRDHTGALLQNGVPYRIFILSLGNSSTRYSSALSSSSSEITLTNSPADIQVKNVRAQDVSDFENGSDIQVSFTIPSPENRVTEYRAFVVRKADVSGFNLAKAQAVPSANYTVITKTGANIDTKLSPITRDMNGNLIKNGVAYRVFILSVGGKANDFKDYLSASSAEFTLTRNMTAAAVTNLKVADTNDFGDGRDLQVSFNKVSDESKIASYRVMIIKSAQADGFNLAAANTISSSNYTTVAKTGNNLVVNLSSGARDVYGEVIREGVAYRVFVLSVSPGGTNALSAASSAITLRQSPPLAGVTNITLADKGNAGNGSDLEVKFNKLADETKLAEYRIMVVKSEFAGSFNLQAANQVTATNYTQVSKTGANITRRLDSTARDVHGTLITPDTSYTVFVLSVAQAGVGGQNALSAASAPITLSNPQVNVVTNVSAFDVLNNGNGQDLEVSFAKAANEAGISFYAVMVVREVDVASFHLGAANGVLPANYTRVDKNGNNHTLRLSAVARDVRGHTITSNVPYRVYVLSIADGVNASINALSSPSATVTLTNKVVTWSGSFQEIITNEETAYSTVTATLSGGTFVTNLVEGVHYTVSNLPNNVTISVNRSATSVVFSLNATGPVNGNIGEITINITPAAWQ